MSATTIDPATLTELPGKLEHYEVETGGYLTAGLAAAERAHGAALQSLLTELTVLVIQPDAIARRQVDDCLAFVRQHGFEPIMAVPFHLTPEMSRALWRFQFNAISEDSKAIGEGVYCFDLSLMLFLRDTRLTATVPRSSRLTAIKGSSDPSKRSPESLRSTLGAINRIFANVHCPDEPLDILRELAILTPEPALSQLHTRLAGAFQDGAAYDCRQEVDQVYAAIAAHDLHSERALARLRADIERAGREHDAVAVAEKLLAMLHAAGQPGETLDWLTFAGQLRDLGIDPYGWDPLLVASNHIEYELPGVAKTIASFSGS
ncbi:nucleoside-diphosphate kinase [Micromonospora sp. WMMD1120]|uniref:nucleoside-diphosphate kinase n=1 Tax=Micromonospora sp. WMMD1120 TaxID=3016106 RepID=UPI002416BC4B|nr:nucleoside-diphosphate kinase [Micromonospora sp. WMMD1120]MDG4808715.1 nucleoside-diphosphate kinase [Micromonospora sp. WMMD1120]